MWRPSSSCSSSCSPDFFCTAPKLYESYTKCISTPATRVRITDTMKQVLYDTLKVTRKNEIRLDSPNDTKTKL